MRFVYKNAFPQRKYIQIADLPLERKIQIRVDKLRNKKPKNISKTDFSELAPVRHCGRFQRIQGV